ncbi:hypothetical protein AK830_g6070 [Neonectria ditissima]|uniref:ABC transporter domain-containing protein n=1 Tax=Neonectria ditissima TaxID=78410 RepID=A0A0P7B254_9HYPO|nr:hypothetical protein AK830_g6070 [Neonectria ditissima]
MAFNLTFLRLWLRQTEALTRKIFLITVVRHWVSTLLRCLIVPIAILVLVLEIQNFSPNSSKFGVGSPSPIQSLPNSLPNGAKLFFVQPSRLGSDVGSVVKKLTESLGSKAKPEIIEGEDELMTRCRTNLNGKTDCYAAVIFNDSPLTSTGHKHWNYTIRVSSASSTSHFDVNQNNNQHNFAYASLQLAIENAMTNSTTIPTSFMFTRTTQEQADTLQRRNFADAIIGGLGIVSFLSMLSSAFHVIGMIASERESGMTQLIDVMGGGAAAARVLSYVVAFDIIYLPCWIIFGLVYSRLLVPASNAGIPVLWQVLSGWALTSTSVFAATIKVRYSAIYIIAILVVMAAFTELLDNQSEPISSHAVMVLSVIFPSSSYIFFLNLLSRFEKSGTAASIHGVPATSDHDIHHVSASTLWGLLMVSIVAFPIMAIIFEHFFHGIGNRRRSFITKSEGESQPTAIKVEGLTKSYKPSLFKRMCCCGRARPIVAVDKIEFMCQKQQVLCLLGVNGSGKTTTMDLISGIQNPTSGSIRINASSSRLGICPQRNIHWEELTVFEHAYIWTMIKGGRTNRQDIVRLIESCDLGPKTDSPVGTLSGGQKRKLQLACMLAGGSTVCLMDEVTTGMDPVSRRAVWNIILAERSERSLILTTHFLDECEVLADQVVIVSRGHVKCQGPVAKLKVLYGGGYRVHLPRTDDMPNTSYPMTVTQTQAIFNTPDSTSAAQLMSSLEAAGHTGALITGPTIEDVFLRVADEKNNMESETGGPSAVDTIPLIESSESADGKLIRHLFTDKPRH